MALLVRRRGYTATRRLDGRTITYRVRPTVYYRRDIGALGRGRKVIPELEEGKMTRVAKEMGYPNVISIPDIKLREFARRLIRRYGERSALGMAQAQVIFRKSGLPHLEKFRRIRDLISEEARRTPGWR
jgi:hypothetical protein